jgi:hypothetical protein
MSEQSDLWAALVALGSCTKIHYMDDIVWDHVQ